MLQFTFSEEPIYNDLDFSVVYKSGKLSFDSDVKLVLNSYKFNIKNI